nr:NUDIX domain-containing protein [Paracoccus aestuariivivens]
MIVLDRTARGGPAVLMGQRGASAAFMPSKYVFPGGAVDPADTSAKMAGPLDPVTRRLLASVSSDSPTSSPEALAAAALRELAEETGLMTGPTGAAPQDWQHYRDAGLSPDPSALIYVFRAITPPGGTRRFDARFLLLDAEKLHGDRHDFSAACDELSHLHWVPLTEARALNLPFITEVVLAEIASIAKRPGPLSGPANVPFFDNRTRDPRFCWIT